MSAIAAAGGRGLAIKTDGEAGGPLWAWGEGSLGLRFDETQGVDRSIPARTFARAIAVATSTSQSSLLQADGTGSHWVWGVGTHSSVLAEGDALLANGPIPIRLARGVYTSVSAGGAIAIAVGRDLALRSWGTNTNGNGFLLGTGTCGSCDPDGDGLSTAGEWAAGTDPWTADTNGDGISDGVAVSTGLSGTDPDVDGDGVPNVLERARGTDPFRADTDGDGSGDALDCFPVDAARWQCPPPNPGDQTPPVINLQEPTSATLVSTVP